MAQKPLMNCSAGRLSELNFSPDIVRFSSQTFRKSATGTPSLQQRAWSFRHKLSGETWRPFPSVSGQLLGSLFRAADETKCKARYLICQNLHFTSFNHARYSQLIFFCFKLCKLFLTSQNIV